MNVPGVPGMCAKASPQPFKSTFADMAFHRSVFLLLMLWSQAPCHCLTAYHMESYWDDGKKLVTCHGLYLQHWRCMALRSRPGQLSTAVSTCQESSCSRSVLAQSAQGRHASPGQTGWGQSPSWSILLCSMPGSTARSPRAHEAVESGSTRARQRLRQGLQRWCLIKSPEHVGGLWGVLT